MAEAQGASAYALGEEKDDAILMARARILQCMVENAKLEEGIEEDPRRHAQAALDYIRDATNLARATENRRLLARVNVARPHFIQRVFRRPGTGRTSPECRHPATRGWLPL